MSYGRTRRLPRLARRSALCALLGLSGLHAQVNVLTANYGNDRTNWNSAETTLNVSNVAGGKFGKLFSMSVDGQVYAQPLYVAGVNIPGKGSRNVVYAATMHNSVFAFDADTGEPLWQVNLGLSVPSSAYFFRDIEDEVGILSTPVIDPAAGLIYVVSDNYDTSTGEYRLHALDLTTGEERMRGPVSIQASVPGRGDGGTNDGTLNFSPFDHLQRPGLLLLNVVVYVAFGSHADQDPYHGWIIGYDASDLTRQVSAFSTTPDTRRGAIWQSGRGMAADSAGSIYAVTGNGEYDGIASFGEAFLRLTANPALSVADSFAPDAWGSLSSNDTDLGSGGPVLVPGTDLVLGGAKDGMVYVLKRSSLGGTQQGNPQVVQILQALDCCGIFNLALWKGPSGVSLYVQGAGNGVRAYHMTGLTFDPMPASENTNVAVSEFGGMAVSSNGATPGTAILWTTSAPSRDIGPGILHAFDAADVSDELWNSDESGGDDTVGVIARYTAPTIANGKVYVPTFSDQLVVYGLRTDPAAISGIANAASGDAHGVAPGELVVLTGTGMGPTVPAAADFVSGTAPADLAGVRVLFDGVAAPLLYVSSTQINAVAPATLQAGSLSSIQVVYGSLTSAPLAAPVAAVAPGLFALDGSGQGPGAILNEDLTVNSAANPAARGSVAVLYGTGAGLPDDTFDPGRVAAAAQSLDLSKVSVSIGGQPAEVLYAGVAPGLIGAALQVNVRLPPDVPSGPAVPVVLGVGGAFSQAGVTIAIQ